MYKKNAQVEVLPALDLCKNSAKWLFFLWAVQHRCTINTSTLYNMHVPGGIHVTWLLAHRYAVCSMWTHSCLVSGVVCVSYERNEIWKRLRNYTRKRKFKNEVTNSRGKGPIFETSRILRNRKPKEADLLGVTVKTWPSICCVFWAFHTRIFFISTTRWCRRWHKQQLLLLLFSVLTWSHRHIVQSVRGHRAGRLQ